MRLSTVFPTALLAASTYASQDAAASQAEDPIPAGAIWTAKWNTVDLQPYTQQCLNRNTYTAKIYKLSERTSPTFSPPFPSFPSPIFVQTLMQKNTVYPDLKDFAPDLKIFYNKQLYAGSWSGVDTHGTARELIQMDLHSVPYKVREWLKANPKQKHFSVQGDNMFFAPGAIYPILPLWVDEPDDLDCEGVFDELDVYSADVGDGKVVGKVAHSASGKEVEFTVEAMVLKKKGKAPTRKDEL
jgi:hypothetical protein